MSNSILNEVFSLCWTQKLVDKKVWQTATTTMFDLSTVEITYYFKWVFKDTLWLKRDEKFM